MVATGGRFIASTESRALLRKEELTAHHRVEPFWRPQTSDLARPLVSLTPRLTWCIFVSTSGLAQLGLEMARLESSFLSTNPSPLIGLQMWREIGRVSAPGHLKSTISWSVGDEDFFLETVFSLDSSLRRDLFCN
tara:strand:- start:38 stop:442 length:405 start_codon:yes stop_codon:yes gene_type:complete